MKRRFLSHLALLLLVAMLLPTTVMAESLIAPPAEEVYNLEQATPPEELPEFQLVAPEAEDTHLLGLLIFNPLLFCIIISFLLFTINMQAILCHNPFLCASSLVLENPKLFPFSS